MMGFKIWRKDSQGWSIAFDEIYSTKISVDERIAELNATYHNLVILGELSFYAYPEEIKIAKNGTIIDNVLKKLSRPISPRRKKFNKKFI
jgi:hypothetical protein